MDKDKLLGIAVAAGFFVAVLIITDVLENLIPERTNQYILCALVFAWMYWSNRRSRS